MAAPLLSRVVLLLAATQLAACSGASRPPETGATPPVKSPSVVVAEPVAPTADEPAAPAAAGSAAAVAPPDAAAASTRAAATAPAGSSRTAPRSHAGPEAQRHAPFATRIPFRGCYETALRADPNLRGSVNVTFIIAKDGSVVHASERGSTVKDPVMRACVVRAFIGLSFPAPDGGPVTVSYPIHFAPPEK